MSQVFSHKTVCIDANFLVALLDVGSSIFGADIRLRVSHLISTLDKAKSLVVVPTPVVAEYLVKADQAGLQSLRKLQGRSLVRICDFNLTAAYECALLDGAALNGSMGKKHGIDAAWQKIKIDRQIVSIARVNGCTAMVSQDDSVAANCNRLGIEVFKFEDLPMPPEAAQKELPLDRVKNSKVTGVVKRKKD